LKIEDCKLNIYGCRFAPSCLKSDTDLGESSFFLDFNNRIFTINRAKKNERMPGSLIQLINRNFTINATHLKTRCQPFSVKNFHNSKKIGF